MFTRKNTLQILLLAVLVLTLSLSLTACQRASQQNSAGETSPVTTTFVVDPDPALVRRRRARKNPVKPPSAEMQKKGGAVNDT